MSEQPEGQEITEKDFDVRMFLLSFKFILYLVFIFVLGTLIWYLWRIFT